MYRVKQSVGHAGKWAVSYCDKQIAEDLSGDSADD